MPRKHQHPVTLLTTYLATIEGSVGMKMFQRFFVEIGGKRTDVLEGGKVSCAVFVSAALIMFGLVKRVHTTVTGTVVDMWGSGDGGASAGPVRARSSSGSRSR